MSFQVSCSHFASVVHIVDPGRRRGNGCVTLIQKGFKTEKSQVKKEKKKSKFKYIKTKSYMWQKDHNKGHRLWWDIVKYKTNQILERKIYEKVQNYKCE